MIKNGHLGGVIDASTADTIRGLDGHADRPDPGGLAARRDVREPPRPAARAAEGERTTCPEQVRGLPHARHRRRRRRPRGVLRLEPRRRHQGRSTSASTATAPRSTTWSTRPARSIMQCTEAIDGDGKPRFVDGISVELNFETVADQEASSRRRDVMPLAARVGVAAPARAARARRRRARGPAGGRRRDAAAAARRPAAYVARIARGEGARPSRARRASGCSPPTRRSRSTARSSARPATPPRRPRCCAAVRAHAPGDHRVRRASATARDARDAW